MISCNATERCCCCCRCLWGHLAGVDTDGDRMTSSRSCRAGQLAGGTDSIGGPFELVNAEGQTVTDADVLTEPSLIYFGYTYCPDVCPLDVERNASAVEFWRNGARA